MSATIRTLPDGRRQVICDACHTQAVTGFADVARRWARNHTCPTPGRVADKDAS